MMVQYVPRGRTCGGLIGVTILRGDIVIRIGIPGN